MLHLVEKLNALESCLRVANHSDAILLIADAVLAINQTELVKANTYNIYALKSDVEAYELLNKVTDAIQLIDYAEFVELTIQHYPIQTWS